MMGPDASPDQIAATNSRAAMLVRQMVSLNEGEQREALQAVVKRIVVSSVDILIEVDPVGLATDVRNCSIADAAAASILLPNRWVGTQFRRHAILPGGTVLEITSEQPKWLIKAIARAVTWYDDLSTGRAASMRHIAECEHVSERYVAQIICLAFIDPARITTSRRIELTGPHKRTDRRGH